MEYPCVSIILPTCNRENYVEKAIISVLTQSYKNFELIIIDDASIDNTSEVIFKFAKKDKRIKMIFNKKNLGTVRSLNKAIEDSKGKYIARIDDDDIWFDSGKLDKQVKFLEENKDYVLVGGGQIRLNQLGKEIGRYLFVEKDKDIRKVMLLSNPFAQTSVVFLKKSFKQTGGYDEKLDFLEDWDLWMRLGKIGKLYNFQEYFFCYRQGNQNKSNKNRIYQSLLSLKFRKKYREYYPNFFKGYILGIGDFCFSLLPFRNFLQPFFLDIRNKFFGKFY